MDDRELDQGRSITLFLKLLQVLVLPILTVILLLRGLIWTAQATPANLVPNPGFESPSPDSWQCEGASPPTCECIWSGSEFYSGEHSAQTYGDASWCNVQWRSASFTVEARSPYTCSGWIKTDDLSDRALLTLAFYSSTSQLDLVEEFACGEVAGSVDWTKVTTDTVDAPDGAQYARVHCKSSGQGTAWFDDIYVEPVPPSNGITSQVYLPWILRYFPPYPVCNGDFETGDFQGWSHGGELDQSVQSESVFEGNYAALLGSPSYPCRGQVPIGEAWMSQIFSVPFCPKPRVAFQYRIFTNDVFHWDTYDSFDVYINDLLVLRTGNVDWDQADCDLEPWTFGWQEFHYHLNGRGGQAIRLSLHNVSRGDHWYNTWTYVDQLVLTCDP